MFRRLLALLTSALALVACEVDVDVTVDLAPDGTGAITVVATADAEVVAAVPSLADDLVLDDIVQAGWVVEGPLPTPDGGLTVSMTHTFLSAGEATNLLKSLGPPFNQMELGRGTTGDVTTNRLSGLLGLSDGFQSFADDELIAAVGSVPFAEQIATAGATPAENMSVTIRASLPGEVVPESTNGTVLDDGTLEWVVPLDGSIAEWQAETRQAPSEGGVWARPLSIAALVVLVAWVAFMVVFIGYVAFARWRRARAYRRRPRPAPPGVRS